MPKSRAIKGIDEDMKLNKALWQMAEVLRNHGAQHQKHYINLFVWPRNQSSPLSDTILQKEGFNLYGWEANGLTIWAVTDAAPETLKTFVELEKRRMAE
jgi:hypothetical protein